MSTRFDLTKGSVVLRIETEKDKLVASIIEIILSADKSKQDRLAMHWPELANELAGLIETTTEYDTPQSWWV